MSRTQAFSTLTFMTSEIPGSANSANNFKMAFNGTEVRPCNTMNPEELEACRLKLLKEEQELIEYAAKREAKIERKLERNKLLYEKWDKDQTKEISRLEAELRTAREERDAAKLAYERGNKTVEQKRLSERQVYQNELLELRRRREDVESRLKPEGAKPGSNSGFQPPERPFDNIHVSDQRNGKESYGHAQMGYGNNQPPGAYWHDPYDATY